MAIRAVFFDAGDTLIHKWVHKRERFLWLCRQAGVALPTDPARLRAGAVAQERFFGDRRTHADARSESWFVRLNRAGLAGMGLSGDLDALAAQVHETAKAVPHVLWIDPEVLPLLQELRQQGLRLAIVSNWDGTLLDQLRPTGLSAWFDAVLDSTVVGSAKPDPRIFELACACTGVQPAEAIHVGDSPGADVAGALAAGVRPVLLDALDMYEEGYAGLPPFGRMLRLAELPGLLADWEAQ